MNREERRAIRNYHTSRQGDDAHQQGWRSQFHQTIRFEQFCNSTDFSNCSILDLSCGKGDFYQYVRKRFAGICYTGIDLIGSFVNEAIARYANHSQATFIHGDFLMGSLPSADWIIASGSLNYATEDRNHPYEIIRAMWDSSNKGVMCNLLDSQTFTGTRILTSFSPTILNDYCKTFARSVQCIEGYLQDDFTIILRK